VKNPFSTLVLLLIASAVATCQPPAKETHAFRWNWHETQQAESTLATNKQISAQEQASLLNALAKQFQRDPDAKKRAAEARIKLVDLNGDGVPEVIVQAVGDLVCSPTGNCPFFVFQKTASGYKSILQRRAVQSFTIQPTRTGGYLDLVLGMHGSATEQDLHVYQFRQGKYRLTACCDANWTYLDKNQEVHELTDPLITPCPR
jgi:hypothetical protein